MAPLGPSPGGAIVLHGHGERHSARRLRGTGVTAEDAKDVLAFMAEVLDEVYQAPARLEAHRTARLARRADSEAQ